ncbi:MAG: (Fe-S)-binding protein [Planctomycetota bacterium]
MTTHQLLREGPRVSAAAEAALVASAALDCVHCGLCLSSCPTYVATGREPSSPRGRIYLMRALAEGRLQPDATVYRDLDECLVCRNCETVCPSGVRFGVMMEHTRDRLEQGPQRDQRTRKLKRLAFRWLLPSPRLLRLLANALDIYQQPKFAPMRRLIHRFLSPATREAEKLMPRIPSGRMRRPLPRVSEPTGAATSRVGLLEGCVAVQLLPEVNRATCRVLNHHDATVVCPPSRPCCGALALHFGDAECAAKQAVRTIDAFARECVEHIVVNSAGCGSAMKEYGRLLQGTKHEARAREFASRVLDVSEWLVKAGIRPPAQALELRVAYDDPCHLLHAQRIAAPPREMLQAIKGVKLVAHEGAETCCGAAGIYSVLQPTLSAVILATKIEALRKANPQVVTTGNPGCLLQIRSGLEQAGLAAIEVLHPVELLDRAYRAVATASRAR